MSICRCLWLRLDDMLNWNRINDRVAADCDLTLLHVMLMLVCDAAIYISIALFMSTLRPGETIMWRSWDTVVKVLVNFRYLTV